LRHQDTRLFRCSINFGILPKQSSTVASRAGKYRQNSRKHSILPVFRARAQERIPTKEPATLYLAGILRPNRVHWKPLELKNTGNPTGKVPSCRYFAQEHRREYRQNSRQRPILPVFRAKTWKNYRQTHPSCTVLNVLECFANAKQATTRSAMYSVLRTCCRASRKSKY